LATVNLCFSSEILNIVGNLFTSPEDTIFRLPLYLYYFYEINGWNLLARRLS